MEGHDTKSAQTLKEERERADPPSSSQESSRLPPLCGPPRMSAPISGRPRGFLFDSWTINIQVHAVVAFSRSLALDVSLNIPCGNLLLGGRCWASQRLAPLQAWPAFLPAALLTGPCSWLSPGLQVQAAPPSQPVAPALDHLRPHPAGPLLSNRV